MVIAHLLSTLPSLGPLWQRLSGIPRFGLDFWFLRASGNHPRTTKRRVGPTFGPLPQPKIGLTPQKFGAAHVHGGELAVGPRYRASKKKITEPPMLHTAAARPRAFASLGVRRTDFDPRVRPPPRIEVAFERKRARILARVLGSGAYFSGS